MAAVPMLAGVGLMMVCSSSLSAFMMMGGDGDDAAAGTGAGADAAGAGADAAGDDAGAGGDDAGAGGDDAGAADADPSCELSRGDNVYTGCGYVYQKESDAIQQCGTGQPLPFIPTGQ